ncbi:hypothetical protein REPUB_Repub07fG0081700 [Reevesia pubescens]
MRFNEIFYVEPEGLSGGLALWWKAHMEVKVIGETKNLIDFVVHITDKDYNLNEVQGQGQFFTWFGIRDGELIKENLDRVLVNLERMEASPNMQVFVKPAMGFDHSLLIMYSKYRDKRAPRIFKFEINWMSMEKCEQLIREKYGKIYEGTKMQQVLQKLCNGRRLLKDWSKKEMPNNRKEFIELLQQVALVQQY